MHPYLEGSDRDHVVVGGNQPIHVTVPFHFSNGLVHQFDIFTGLFHNRLRLCKFATFGGCCAKCRGSQGGDICTNIKGVRVLWGTSKIGWDGREYNPLTGLDVLSLYRSWSIKKRRTITGVFPSAKRTREIALSRVLRTKYSATSVKSFARGTYV